ncbi:TPA: hypothetical protein ACQVH3_004665 [Serratia marcescens]
MDNKLSELSNNARKAANSFFHWSQMADCTSKRVSCLTVEQLKDTSELLSALLAELKSSQAIANEYQQLMHHMDAGGDFYEFQRDMKEQSNG